MKSNQKEKKYFFQLVKDNSFNLVNLKRATCINSTWKRIQQTDFKSISTVLTTLDMTQKLHYFSLYIWIFNPLAPSAAIKIMFWKRKRSLVTHHTTSISFNISQNSAGSVVTILGCCHYSYSVFWTRIMKHHQLISVRQTLSTLVMMTLLQSLGQWEVNDDYSI